MLPAVSISFCLLLFANWHFCRENIIYILRAKVISSSSKKNIQFYILYRKIFKNLLCFLKWLVYGNKNKIIINRCRKILFISNDMAFITSNFDKITNIKIITDYLFHACAIHFSFFDMICDFYSKNKINKRN